MNNKRQRKFAILAGGLVTLLGFQAVLAVAQEDAGAQESSVAQESAATQEGTLAPDDKSPISFSISQSVTRNNNFSYYSTKEKKRGATIYTTRASINFDKEYSRQAFHAGLAASYTKYSTNSNLNNVSPDASLRWDWRVGDRWSGVLGCNYSNSFIPFDDKHTSANVDEQDKDMRELTRCNASADFWWHPNWATGFGYSDARTDYSSSALSRSKQNTQTKSLNFTYRPSTGNRIVLSYLAQDGEYPNQGKTDPQREWSQRDGRISAQWRLSGVTQLSGYIGFTKRKYDWASNRNFSGATGNIAVHWTPTAKALIDLSWRREIGADEDYMTNYAVSEVWAFRPTWVVTSKIRLGASYEHRKRDYHKYLDTAGKDQEWRYRPKDDKTTSYGLSLQYLPVPNANIELGYRHQSRNATSDRDDLDFRARTIWLSGRMTF